MKIHSKKSKQNSSRGFTPAPKYGARAGLIRKSNSLVRGFTLIELLVSMFILLMVMGAMVAVSMAVFRSYQKSRAIKAVTEDVGFALNSIAKDVRMGSIEKSSTYANGQPKKKLMLTRNSTGERICYVISDDNTKLTVFENTTNCSDGTPKVLVDLSNTGVTGMTFHGTSGFRACPSAISVTDSGYGACSLDLGRGWAEINLNIESPTMETDSIQAQVTVSSRDYGWEEVQQPGP